MKGIIIAAPQSGSGKTTVSLGIMAALTRRGMKVAAFKAGPDFIDPGYHRLVTGRPSVNLDGWICPPEFVLQTYCHHASQADIAVVEGVMGLFDGLGASSQEGSTAQIARITGAPVVLVVNARGMAASIVPLVAGFMKFDASVKIAGVIFNNVGSDNHVGLLTEALKNSCPDLPVLGSLPREEKLEIPSRHLGLVTAEDNPLSEEYTGRLADLIERNINLELLEKVAEYRQVEPVVPEEHSVGFSREPVQIAVASDRAFCFMYEDNLRLLKDAGAQLSFFSPITDHELPPGCKGIYLPGGYPELYQAQLADNRLMLDSIQRAAILGVPIYAECGGLVYLTKGLVSQPGEEVLYPLVDFFPVTAVMGTRRAALGYRDIELAEDTIIGIRGEQMRGHEFHYSTITEMPAYIDRSYLVSRPGEQARMEGYRINNCLASYVHLHFGSLPHGARFLVEACRLGGRMLGRIEENIPLHLLASLRR